MTKKERRVAAELVMVQEIAAIAHEIMWRRRWTPRWVLGEMLKNARPYSYEQATR